MQSSSKVFIYYQCWNLILSKLSSLCSKNKIKSQCVILYCEYDVHHIRNSQIFCCYAIWSVSSKGFLCTFSFEKRKRKIRKIISKKTPHIPIKTENDILNPNEHNIQVNSAGESLLVFGIKSSMSQTLYTNALSNRLPCI